MWLVSEIEIVSMFVYHLHFHSLLLHAAYHRTLFNDAFSSLLLDWSWSHLNIITPIVTLTAAVNVDDSVRRLYVPLSRTLSPPDVCRVI